MFDARDPTDYAVELGGRLRALRLQRNVTQAHVARHAGISRPTLSALESSGKATLVTLARVMYFFGREGELEELLRPDPPSTQDEAVAPKTRRRARQQRSLWH